jgi:hypothetical protein
MPDLTSMSVSKSSSMTDIIQTTLNDGPSQGSRAFTGVAIPLVKAYTAVLLFNLHWCLL